MALSWKDLDTPALLIERRIMLSNLQRMQDLADEFGLHLRPHVKTHKCAQLAQLQIQFGAIGVAAAKLSEAEAMVAGGILDIHIANQIVGPRKIERLMELSGRASVSCAVDAIENVRELSAACAARGSHLNLLIEVDTGLHRCGLSDFESVLRLAREIIQLPGVQFAGLMTHAGHAYGAADAAERASIGRHEGEQMVDLTRKLEREGLTVPEVSVGSTPTAAFAARVPGVTELRVGNYIFNDATQVALGVATYAECALTVLTRVISRPAPGRLVIDAGSKTFSSDIGAHGRRVVTGYGYPGEIPAKLVRLSEEHGVLEGRVENVAVGRLLRVVPNHACAVMNLADRAYVVDGDLVVQELDITARGAVT